MRANGELARAFRAGELDWLLLVIVFVTIFLALLIFYLSSLRDKERDEKRAREQARQIVSDEWQAINHGGFSDAKGRPMAVVLEIQTLDCKKRKQIPFRPAHPSIADIQTLEPYDIISFEFVEEGMECALGNDVCGYLRLKA